MHTINQQPSTIRGEAQLAKPTELQQRAFNLIDTAIPTRLS
jgi:hypothetical protein